MVDLEVGEIRLLPAAAPLSLPSWRQAWKVHCNSFSALVHIATAILTEFRWALSPDEVKQWMSTTTFMFPSISHNSSATIAVVLSDSNWISGARFSIVLKLYVPPQCSPPSQPANLFCTWPVSLVCSKRIQINFKFETTESLNSFAFLSVWGLRYWQSQVCTWVGR